MKRSKIDRMEAKEIADRVRAARKAEIEAEKTRILHTIETIANLGRYRVTIVSPLADEITEFLVNRNFLTYGRKGSPELTITWD